MINEGEALKKVLLTNERLNNVINEFKFITEARITYNNTILVNYVTLLQARAQYYYLQGMYHASPGFIAILIAIWQVLYWVYKGIVWVIDLLRIKEILQIADVLKIIWPEFRRKYDQILGKISEFSAQIGFGVDGLIHLIQGAQGGLNVIKGLTGKSWEWLEIAGATKAIKAMETVSALSFAISTNPATVLSSAFRLPNEDSSREVALWWSNTAEWITTAAENAETAIKRVNDTIGEFLEFKNDLPQFVIDIIPKELFEGLEWVDAQIDNTILPKLTEIGQTMTIINAQLEAQRAKAQELADRLAHPGDILNTLNELPEDERIQQEDMLDEAVSGQFGRENEEEKVELKPIWEGFQILLDALSEPPPTPTYLEIEDRPAPVIRFPKAVVYTSWDIYDFVA